MKSGKSFIRVLLTVVMLLCAMCFVACGKVEFKIDFIVDNAVYATINTNGKEMLKMPNDPEKDGYIFDGWYWDDENWGKPFTANSLLDAPLSSNMQVFAKWSEIHSHTFDKQVATEEYLAVSASCKGRAKYYYSCSCGKKGTTTFEFGDIPDHSFTHYVSDGNATCIKDGTKTAHCDYDGCEEIDTVIDTNSKLNHNYDAAVFVWSDDYLTCTATRVCKNDNSHKETETGYCCKNHNSTTILQFG